MSTAEDCHELLLRFAGRIDDRELWRLRDWVAAGAVDAVARALPLMLLRERVGITPEESRALGAVLVPAGADPERLNAVPWVDDVPELGYTFTAESPEWVSRGDSLAVVLGALLRGRPEVVEARSSWRRGRSGDTRVVLVTVTEGPVRLVGELQRVLRALGSDEPAVEVLVRGHEVPQYHREALAASEPLIALAHH
ncbi:MULTISPECIES: hypothetical protein [Actinokineospora]|uniref:Uncharacterized protein n=1 Tax=Actinokineospora fastidiosa TaxID=1816 RepID=A0A918G551_9PSEU|nr:MULTISPECIES: hypothetical protein [Actinokineospora]UVS76573.1 hypothetical protein Actkin_00266 [Actinokineospora sp. UTMC 2448]GGS17282.1 hypothetical protein GCM10010171_07010 [Actinokineospora fastidiosa]